MKKEIIKEEYVLTEGQVTLRFFGWVIIVTLIAIGVYFA